MSKINSWYHAEAAAKKWGGIADDYIDIHEFIDSSKRIIGDVRHRSIYHHTEGVWLCQRIFGRTITVDDKHPRDVPVRLIAELHIIQDLGWIPSPADYIKGMPVAAWMGGAIKTERDLSDIFPPRQVGRQLEQTYYDRPARPIDPLNLKFQIKEND